ncbi:Ohr family peroxiredoxin [Sphingomonas sp. BLCC-B65]|nr:Ohr family peroxiredoxin [Sphingomonas sp. BLCC-B65]
MNTLYTAEATASGDGRSGHISTPDGVLDTDMRVPAEMGGPGGAPNPEILFAAGYAACFHGSLQLAARMRKISLHDSSVTARVNLGADDDGSYRLAASLGRAFRASLSNRLASSSTPRTRSAPIRTRRATTSRS